MPIANCIISLDQPKQLDISDEIIELWGKYSGKDTSEMTVMISHSDEQLGKAYSAICCLYLPNVWSRESVSALQVGLANALADCLAVELSDIMIMTSMIESGFVVEKGREVKWVEKQNNNA